MRWETNAPKYGDLRQSVRFAWLPVGLSDGTTVWLERYILTERYDSNGYDYIGWLRARRTAITKTADEGRR